MKRIQSFIEESVANGDVAGVNVLILREGEEIFYGEAGYANIEDKKPFKRDAILRMYSMTKPIVAAGIMLLIERGIIGKSQMVQNFLPGFKDIKVATPNGMESAKRPVLINDLMNMTSGLTYAEDEMADGIHRDVFGKVKDLFTDIVDSMDGSQPIDTIEAANRLGSFGLAFHPGQQWLYGTSADVLGAIIEVVTGMDLADFLDKEFFKPLDMPDTGFFVPPAKADRLADVYKTTEHGLEIDRDNLLGMLYDRSSLPAFKSGGAGLVSTIDDYSHFSQMLLNGGSYDGRQILSPVTAATMATGAMTPWQNESMWRYWQSMLGYTYGNLMRHNIYPGMNMVMSEIDEYGWDGMLGTFFANMPCSGITYLIGQQTHIVDEKKTYKEILRNVIMSSLYA